MYLKVFSQNIDIMVSQLKDNIQKEIKDASTASGEIILSAIVHSSGEFVNSLKEEVSNEILVLNAVGDFLIATAKYIQSASNEFVNVDTKYKTSKIT